MRLRWGIGVASAVALCVAAGAACSSFDDAPTSNVDDAGDAGDANVVTPSDASTSDSAGPQTCVPDPDEPVDAGPEPTNCGGIDVLLATSSDNCGFCGNVCGPKNPCQGGACTPELVASGDQFFEVSAVSTATDVFAALNTNNCASGNIVRIPRSGGDPVTAVDAPGYCTFQVVAVGDRLFYWHGSDGIRSASLSAPGADGGHPVRSNAVSGFHATPTALFWMEGATRVLRSDHDGANPLAVHDDSTSGIFVGFLRGDADSAWWMTAPIADAGVAQDIWMRSSSGTNTVRRFTGLEGVIDLVLDDEWVYLLRFDGTLMRARKGSDGGAPAKIGQVDVTNRPLRSMTLLGDYIYVVAGEPFSAVASAPFDLFRIKKCGGRTRRIAHGIMDQNAIVPIGKQLYFAGRNGAGTIERFDVTTN